MNRYFPGKSILIISVTIDGGKNYQGAVRDYIGSSDRIWCKDHLLNLAGKDTAASDPWKTDIAMVKRIQGFIVGDGILFRKYKSLCTELLGKEYQFIFESDTRWLYFGDVIDRIVLVFPALQAMYDSDCFENDSELQAFIASEPLRKLKVMSSSIAILRELLVKCQTQSAIIAPLIPEWIQQVYRHLARRIAALPEGSSLRQYPQSLLDNVRGRLNDTFTTVNPILMSAVLHPLYCELEYCTPGVKTEVYNAVMQCIVEITACPKEFKASLLSGIHEEMRTWGRQHPNYLKDPDCARLFWCELKHGKPVTPEFFCMLLC